MALLNGLEIRELLAEGVIVIESKEPSLPFSVDNQITEDAIDLRISNVGKVVKKAVQVVDVLNSDLDVFEDISIPGSGYTLKHGEVLFTNTLEVVKLPPTIAGRLGSRSTFARYGLSVHCSHPKVAVGHFQSIPLQIINHNTVDLIIYPHTPILQLQLEVIRGEEVYYMGKYRGERELKTPIVTPRDKDIYSPSTRTGHIIRAEVEKFRKELLDSVDEIKKKRGAEVEITEADIKFIKIPKNRLDILEWILVGVAFLFIGWGISIVLDGNLDYWKIVSIVVSIVCGIVLMVVAAVLQYHK